MSAAAVFDAIFRRAEPFAVHGPGGGVILDPALWCRDDIPGDAGLLAACLSPAVSPGPGGGRAFDAGRSAGPVLDVGCGPGRLTAALASAGVPALGIDVSAAAVRMARGRGATALRRDVFEPVPAAGRWTHLLLADGNIGIGGDPQRLLRRCRELLGPDGQVHVELAPPGTPSWAGPALACRGAEVASLAWAAVAADDLGDLAVRAALRVLRTWTEAGRWFATLSPR